jgi:hypothetical protein
MYFCSKKHNFFRRPNHFPDQKLVNLKSLVYDANLQHFTIEWSRADRMLWEVHVGSL